MDAGEIGVITPLKQQQNLIREKLLQIRHSSSFNLSFCEGREDQATRAEAAGWCNHGDASVSCSSVEVNTVDKYQGRDKECIIVSCTRSNSKGNVSGVWMDIPHLHVVLKDRHLLSRWLCLLNGWFTYDMPEHGLGWMIPHECDLCFMPRISVCCVDNNIVQIILDIVYRKCWTFPSQKSFMNSP